MELTGTGTAADAGTWRREQGRAAEAGRRWVQAESRCAALRTRIRGGERVKMDRDSNRNSYGWGGGRKEGEKERPRKWEKKVGRKGHIKE